MILYEYKIVSVHLDSSKVQGVLRVLENGKWRVRRCSALNGRFDALLERVGPADGDK